MTNNLTFSQYNNVFCDSLRALEWAYKKGLPKDAIVYTSSPALLWGKKKYINNIENRWNVNELKKFQDGVPEVSELIFDTLYNTNHVVREIALVYSLSVYQFQKVIYKAACLNEENYKNPVLFIYVDGNTGTAGNIMNSPWGDLLSPNLLLSMVSYKLPDDEWKSQGTSGISYWRRFKVAGYKTIVYRLAIRLMNILPESFFKKNILIAGENELNIEIASSLALHGVGIKRIKPESLLKVEDIKLDKDFEKLYSVVSPIIRKRIEEWVIPFAVDNLMNMYKSHLEDCIKQFKISVDKWDKSIYRCCSVLTNAAGSIDGKALSYVCKRKNIPLISSQHGVTVEISKAHNMLHIRFDSSTADVVFSYNLKNAESESKSYYSKSKFYVVGMPERLIGMKNLRFDNNSTPVVYISTNLYQMGLSQSLKTDYGRAIDEYNLIANIFGRLPHKICYKTYPEDNRRYADTDPILNEVKAFDNIEVFSDKVDMRYLIANYRILVTTCATSTLGWPVMSGRPVIFINQKNNNPLTDDAHKSLSRGIFVFDDSKDSFYKDLKEFLSQPIEIIENLYKEKKYAREEMIGDYFSAYSDGAGERAAEIILHKDL